MSMPSPFEIGRAVGENVSGGIRSGAEDSALDQVLRQAQMSNDPRFQDDVIRQILTRVSPEKQQAALSVIKNTQDRMQRQRQREALQAEGYNPDLPEYAIKENIKRETSQIAGDRKRMQEIESVNKSANNALNLVNRQRELLKTGHLGPIFSFTGTGRKLGTSYKEGIKTRAEYKQIGKALVQAASPLKITNRAEFQHYSETLDDENATKEQITGALDGLERVIRNSMIQDSNQVQKQLVQPTVEQVQDSIFKGKPNLEFSRPDGSKINVSKGNNQQMISALSQGYAPPGFVAMLAPDGLPDLVPIDEVQNELNNGSIVIYGY